MDFTPYSYLDTPSLLIDLDQALENIHWMQEKINALGNGVTLRPHTKTHRIPWFAQQQVAAGAKGIAVAKLGEAEVMADNGLDDIFIANELVGIQKYERLLALHRRIKIRVGVDSAFQIDQIEQVFSQEARPLEVLIEYEVGENRTGVITDQQLIDLVTYIQTKEHVVLKGIFSHEGHTYKAPTRQAAAELALESHRRTVRAAEIMRSLGADIDTVSVGATPALLNGGVAEGVTEVRIGTYIFMDVGQSFAMGSFDKCAASVLATVISKPNDERVVLDTGAKALVSQNRSGGICSTNGYGCIKGRESVRLDNLFDEHGVINSKSFHEEVEVGQKVEVIPSHICPTVNLYDSAYFVSGGKILKEVPILCRGKSR